jgi:hypothetical protein
MPIARLLVTPRIVLAGHADFAQVDLCVRAHRLPDRVAFEIESVCDLDASSSRLTRECGHPASSIARSGRANRPRAHATAKSPEPLAQRLALLGSRHRLAEPHSRLQLPRG